MMASNLKFMRIALLPLIFCVLLVGYITPLMAQTPANCKISVRATGLRNATGNVRITLRRSADSVVESRVVDIDAKTLTAQTVFDKLPEGVYSVGLIHDENKNGKLDMDEMGLPQEGYGHSNNPGKRMGPPSFDETKFTLTQTGASLEIGIIYWQ